MSVELVKNPCCWCYPPGSEYRNQLKASLKPDQGITDGICPPCKAKLMAEAQILIYGRKRE